MMKKTRELRAPKQRLSSGAFDASTPSLRGGAEPRVGDTAVGSGSQL